MASMLQQSLGSSSAWFIATVPDEDQPRALEAAEKRTSKPSTRWAIKTLKRNIDLGGRVAIALEEDSCKLRMLASPPSSPTFRLGWAFFLSWTEDGN